MSEREPHRQLRACRTSGSRRAGPRRSGGWSFSPGKLPKVGLCSSRSGKVVGSRPAGSASPKRTSAIADAISWPPSHTCTTAATSSAQGIVTGDPALTTTTVRGFAGDAPDATSSSWSPGRSMVSRSWPSLSHSSLVPTTHHGDVARRGGRDGVVDRVGRVRPDAGRP